MPAIETLHTPDEDEAFWRDQVLTTCTVLGAFRDEELVGVIAFGSGRIEHLYVAPTHQRSGIGGVLLTQAMEAQDELFLWTFQANETARTFYERFGFRVEKETDGAGNEEREPDVLYRWTRDTGP